MGEKLVEEPGDLFLSAPPNAILVHACNTRGSWGAGIALAFKQRFPAAYSAQYAHCCPSAKDLKDHKAKGPNRPTNLAAYQRSLVGTALLIAPPPLSRNGEEGKEDADAAAARKRKRSEEDASAARVPVLDSGSSSKASGATATGTYVACLFTSYSYGRAKDTPTAILAATRAALRDLVDQIASIPAPPAASSGDLNSAHSSPSAAATHGWVCAMPRINSGLFGVPWEQTRAVLEEVLVAAGVSVLVFVPGEDGPPKSGGRRLGEKVHKAEDKKHEDGDGNGEGGGDGANRKKKAKLPLRRDPTSNAKESAGKAGKRATGMDRWLQGRQ